MSETIVIEAVSDKFKNKYSAGSILAGGTWMQVSSKLNLADFVKDSQIEVETKTNDKGYTSIIGIVKGAVKEAAKTEAKKETKKETAPAARSYDDTKNTRILVQGITQAVAQSPALVNISDPADLVETIKNVSLQLIDFVLEQSK